MFYQFCSLLIKVASFQQGIWFDRATLFLAAERKSRV